MFQKTCTSKSADKTNMGPSTSFNSRDDPFRLQTLGSTHGEWALELVTSPPASGQAGARTLVEAGTATRRSALDMPRERLGKPVK